MAIGFGEGEGHLRQQKAILKDAILTEANLYEAVLIGTEVFTYQLETVTNLKGANLPDGVQCP